MNEHGRAKYYERTRAPGNRGPAPGRMDVGRVRASLEVARRRGRYYEVVPVGVLEALLAVVDAAWGPARFITALRDALEPFAPAEEPEHAESPFDAPRRGTARAFNERMQAEERARVLADLGIEVVPVGAQAAEHDEPDTAVSDAVSSCAGGRSASLTGRDLPHISPSGPAPPPDRARADVAAAFEQWSQGGGSSGSTWTVTRAEAAFVFAGLRGRIEQVERERDHGQRLLEVERYDRQAAEARLARVPALVETGKRMRGSFFADATLAVAWDAALAAWEQA